MSLSDMKDHEIAEILLDDFEVVLVVHGNKDYDKAIQHGTSRTYAYKVPKGLALQVGAMLVVPVFRDITNDDEKREGYSLARVIAYTEQGEGYDSTYPLRYAVQVVDFSGYEAANKKFSEVKASIGKGRREAVRKQLRETVLGEFPEIAVKAEVNV